MKFFNLLLLCFFLCSLSFTSQAQTHQDIGIRFSSIQNFGFIYKTELKKDYYFRISAASFSLGLNDSQNSSRFHASVGFGAGVEKRHSMTDKFSFIHGLNLYLTTGYYVNSNNRNFLQISPSVGYMLGVHYSITPDIYVNVEINPSLRANISSDSYNNTNLGMRFDGNIRGLMFGLVYNFKK